MKKKYGDSLGLTGGFVECSGSETPPIPMVLPFLEHGFFITDKETITIHDGILGGTGWREV